MQLAPLKTAIFAAATLLLSSCGGESQMVQQPPPKTVGTYTIEAQPIDLTVELPGRTVAYRRAEVRPQVEGIIKQRLFREGAEVTAGQHLYQIESNKYQASFEYAKANVNKAAVLRDRYRELLQTGAVSKQQYDDADAAWQLAQAELELARIDLENTRVLAPLSGRIGRSAVSEGALVNDGQSEAMATILQIDPIYVDITQPVAEMLKLQKALARGELTSDSEGGAQLQLLLENRELFDQQGTLRFSEASVDQSTGSVTLRAVIRNPEKRLLPGMFVHARLQQGRKSDALLVPQQAIQRDATGAPAVWVVNPDNSVTLRSLDIARPVGNMWLVNSGLTDGEQVVTEGTLQLRDGQMVDPVPASNVKPQLEFERFALAR